jgi:hypothetical protein
VDIVDYWLAHVLWFVKGLLMFCGGWLKKGKKKKKKEYKKNKPTI